MPLHGAAPSAIRLREDFFGNGRARGRRALPPTSTFGEGTTSQTEGDPVDIDDLLQIRCITHVVTQHEDAPPCRRGVTGGDVRKEGTNQKYKTSAAIDEK